MIKLDVVKNKRWSSVAEIKGSIKNIKHIKEVHT